MMSRLKTSIALSAAFIAASTALVANEPALPVDPDAAVIELWYLNGQTPSHPEVIILSDGRMQVMSPEGPLRATLPAQRLRELMTKLWHVDGLKSVAPESLQHSIQVAASRTGLTPNIEGAGETVLRIRMAGEVRELRCPAVGILAVRFPDVPAVQSIAAAQRRLENVRAVASVGGHDEAVYLAEVATRAVQDEYGVDVPVSSADLSMVRSLPDGSRFCQFLVQPQDAEPKPVQMISIVETPGHLPRVSIIGGPVTR